MIHIVLYRPEKPQNTGNIMRTCVAIHACLHIIGPLSFSIDSKDLKRVGMDYIDDLKMFYYEDYGSFIKKHGGVCMRTEWALREACKEFIVL